MSALADKPLRGVRVLLVDDDDDTRDLWTMVFEGAGADVRVAGDIDAVVRCASEWSPSILVSDLVMPDGDGFSCLRELRSIAGLAAVPAVAVSGMMHPQARVDALAAGFQVCIEKPVFPDDLVEAVGRCVRTFSADRAERS